MALLRHIHLPGLTSYRSVGQFQQTLVRAILDSKKTQSKGGTASVPDPTLITFQTSPTYTCGLRDSGRLSAEQIGYLTRARGAAAPAAGPAGGPALAADFVAADRGGQITFHGPGQVTAYLVADLRAHGAGAGAREYVGRLEEAVIRTCAAVGVRAGRTGRTGVWVGEAGMDVDGADGTDEPGREKVRNVVGPGDSPPAAGPRKVGAIGVHLRRYVSSHGVGLNVCPDLGWFGRIRACGVDGRLSTSLEREGAVLPGAGEGEERMVEAVADLLARQMAAVVVPAVSGVERVRGEWPELRAG